MTTSRLPTYDEKITLQCDIRGCVGSGRFKFVTADGEHVDLCERHETIQRRGQGNRASE